MQLRERSGLPGICGVEVRNKFRGVVEFRSKDPGRFFVSSFVASPPDQVQELASTASSIYLGIQDFGDLEFRFAVDQYGRWRVLDAAGNGVRSSGFQLGDMEHRVYGVHGVWQSESEGMGSDFGDNVEGSEILLRKLFRWPSRTEILSFDEYLISKLEVQSRKSMLVCLALVPLLG